jgi:hypothetical protein
MREKPRMKRLAALLPLLSACGAPPAAGPGAKIDCAVDGTVVLERRCTLERTPEGLLTLRSPSGSFRRLVETGDGRIVAADGAEPATVKPLGRDLIEVSVGGDRYRLPVRTR